MKAGVADRSGGCAFTGPGRGDCAHFLGLPATFDARNTDAYGKPHGWCWICWRVHREETAFARGWGEGREAAAAWHDEQAVIGEGRQSIDRAPKHRDDARSIRALRAPKAGK